MVTGPLACWTVAEGTALVRQGTLRGQLFVSSPCPEKLYAFSDFLQQARRLAFIKTIACRLCAAAVAIRHSSITSGKICIFYFEQRNFAVCEKPFYG